MKKFKKLVALVLAFAMVLSMNVVSFAAATDFADVTDADQQEAVALLTTLGVVNGYPDGTYKPANVVTRAEMAKLVISALGYGSLATSTTTNYSDMSAAAWAEGFVGLADGIGIVKGYPNGTFQPNATVTYAEAATMVVRALGYTDENLGGTWPNNYLAKAIDLNIFDDVDMSGTGAVRGDVAVMIYNAVQLPIGKVNADNDWTDNVPADNMLLRLDAKEIAEAVITGDEDTTMNLRPWVGVLASGYMNDDDEIILLNQEETVLVGEFDFDTTGDDFEDVDGKEYSVATDATSGAAFFLNGEEVTSMELVEGDEYTISAEVSGLTIKKVFAISAWEVDENDQFEDYDMDDIEDDQDLFDLAFELNDDEEIDNWSFELVGVDSLEDIEEEDVVYVYAGADYIRKIVVGTEEVSGTLSRISSDGDDYTVGGKVYSKVDDSNVILPTSDSVDVGDDVTLTLDGFGKIYKVDADSAVGSDYAVVLETDNGEEGLSSSDPLVKMFLNDGSDQVFSVDYEEAGTIGFFKVADGNVNWTDGWVATSPAMTLVEYGTNGDGDIDYLDDAVVATTTDADITARGYYAGYEIDDNAVIYVFDGNETDSKADEDNYYVASLSQVLDTVDVDAQYVLDDGVIVAMLIENGADVSSEDDVFAVVNDYAEVDAATDYEIMVLVDGSAVTYAFDGTNPGSYVTSAPALYELGFNASDEVNALDEVVTEADVVKTTDSAYEYTVDGNRILRKDSSTDEFEYFMTMSSDVVVYEFDAVDKDYEAGTVRDIGDYTDMVVYTGLYEGTEGIVDVVILYTVAD